MFKSNYKVRSDKVVKGKKVKYLKLELIYNQ